MSTEIVGGAVAGDVARARYGYLDALRGVAVLLVLVQHVGELAVPAVATVSRTTVQLGQLGVMVFFACSGFIIPMSLERAGNLRDFWIGRFFRLYPLYWVSLAAALVLATRGVYGGADQLTGSSWLANVTMVQGFLGEPDAIGLYWSLAWEMAFYAGMSMLFVVGLHRFSVPLAIGTSAALVVAFVAADAAGQVHLLPVGVFAFAMMLHGTVYFRWVTGVVTTRQLLVVVVSTGVCGAVIASLGTFGADSSASTASLEARSMLSAWLSALVIFGVAVVAGRGGHHGWRWLRLVGVVSFSIYLLQGLVLGSVELSPSTPAALRIGVWVALTLGLSVATYLVVERPAIRLGRRIIRSRSVKPALDPAPAA